MSFDPHCRLAWRGGSRIAPSWCYWQLIAAVDGVGFHALVRAAGLPRAELIHMGATPELLSSSSRPVTIEHAAPLLGRIELDREYDSTGGHYADIQHEQAYALQLGLSVIARHFEPFA